jgi:hypothetical protein
MAISKETLGSVLSTSNPNQLADALKKVNLGVMLAPVEETITQAASTTVALSKKAFGPAMIHARVTGGVSVGKYVCSDSAGIAVDVGAEIGVCKLAADGLSLVFASNVTACVVSYMAASEMSLSDIWSGSGAGTI